MSALMPETASRTSSRRPLGTVTELDEARERHVSVRTPRNPYTLQHELDEVRACENHERPEIFSPRDHQELFEAIATCTPCPVRDLCETQGRQNREWGVWGGVLMREGRTAHRFTRDKERWLLDLDDDAQTREGGPPDLPPHR